MKSPSRLPKVVVEGESKGLVIVEDRQRHVAALKHGRYAKGAVVRRVRNYQIAHQLRILEGLLADEGRALTAIESPLARDYVALGVVAEWQLSDLMARHKRGEELPPKAVDSWRGCLRDRALIAESLALTPVAKAKLAGSLVDLKKRAAEEAQARIRARARS